MSHKTVGVGGKRVGLQVGIPCFTWLPSRKQVAVGSRYLPPPDTRSNRLWCPQKLFDKPFEISVGAVAFPPLSCKPRTHSLTPMVATSLQREIYAKLLSTRLFQVYFAHQSCSR
jgi:hypothetical protein